MREIALDLLSSLINWVYVNLARMKCQIDTHSTLNSIGELSNSIASSLAKVLIRFSPLPLELLSSLIQLQNDLIELEISPIELERVLFVQ